MHDWTFDFLRRQIVGIDSAFDTPFGRRLMVYCDYTASGRCLVFVERYLQTPAAHLREHAHRGRPHRPQHEPPAARGRTDDQGVGQRGSRRGASSPAAPARPARSTSCSRSSASRCAPATRRAVGDRVREFLGEEQFEAFRALPAAHQPVVFVGPYEHHSNEVTWRQGLATVVEVNLAADGGVDLAHLEELLRATRNTRGRLRIGSFSAASNVTGMRSPVHEIARLLHAHDAYACFDYAASAPYVEIDMNPAPDPASGDAVDRRGVSLAAQVPRRPRLERRAGVQRAPVPARPRRRASAAAARSTT